MQRDFAFRRPEQYFLVPERERSSRIRESDDLCIIDGEFFIRGVMQIPIIDRPGEYIGWGFWVSVSKSAFIRYCKLGNGDGRGERPFRGRLAVSPPNYSDLLGAPVRVRLQESPLRPLFEATTFDHPLFREQRDGVTAARWHQIVTEIEEYQSRRVH